MNIHLRKSEVSKEKLIRKKLSHSVSGSIFSNPHRQSSMDIHGEPVQRKRPVTRFSRRDGSEVHVGVEISSLCASWLAFWQPTGVNHPQHQSTDVLASTRDDHRCHDAKISRSDTRTDRRWARSSPNATWKPYDEQNNSHIYNAWVSAPKLSKDLWFHHLQEWGQVGTSVQSPKLHLVTSQWMVMEELETKKRPQCSIHLLHVPKKARPPNNLMQGNSQAWQQPTWTLHLPTIGLPDATYMQCPDGLLTCDNISPGHEKKKRSWGYKLENHCQIPNNMQ